MGLVEQVQGRLPQGGEFQGRNGDCAEYALMVARAAVSPQAVISADELNRLTTESINAGQAGPAGQMTDANLVFLCVQEHIEYQQNPYDRNALYYWLSQGRAVDLGFQNGQALPGNEQGVQGHCVCLLAALPDGFVLANGDSANGRAGQLDTGVLIEQIEAAQPTTMTIIFPDARPTVDVAAIRAAAQQILSLAVG